MKPKRIKFNGGFKYGPIPESPPRFEKWRKVTEMTVPASSGIQVQRTRGMEDLTTAPVIVRKIRRK